MGPNFTREWSFLFSRPTTISFIGLIIELERRLSPCLTIALWYVQKSYEECVDGAGEVGKGRNPVKRNHRWAHGLVKWTEPDLISETPNRP